MCVKPIGDIWVPQAPAFPPGVFDEDPLLDFDLAPGKSQQALTYRGPGHDISSNRWGCFDFDRGTGDDYILVIGGDAAWGQVPLTHHWATVLENELGSRVLKNAGFLEPARPIMFKRPSV